MELPGANYLYPLATVSVTFVGFSALLLVYHRRPDDGVPQLLSFYGMSHTSVWRPSNLIIAIPIFLFVAKIPGRRRAATKEPIPFFVGFLLLQFLARVYLVPNAVGWPPPSQLAAFAMALTALLFTTGIAYLTGLARVLRGDRGKT